ncbi:MAG: hypothetical protein V4534_02240 [Myxococcota bacterium]
MVMKRLLKMVFKSFKSSLPEAKTSEKKLDNLKISKSFEPIYSERADQIYRRLHPHDLPLLHQEAELDGKRSLAWILWAFKAADDAAYYDGISVHDVSALVFQAAEVELYPINVSRMVHSHNHYIKQVSQDKKTKRYLLTEDGLKAVQKLKK